LGAIEKMSRVQRDRISNDAERAHGLSDEPGQAAIYSVADDPAFIDGLANPQGNIAGGEGFDWFYASAADRSAQVRTPITDGAAGKPWVFRYKDLRAWWTNAHYDRPGGVESGTPTAWVPQSKPVWFTELGCPAIDRGTNQPNVFFDPKSSESFTPHFSRGWRDDAIQRAYLEATYLWWGEAANNPVSDATTHLLLPYILAAQAQKHVTHNEALRILDGLVQLSVLDRNLRDRSAASARSCGPRSRAHAPPTSRLAGTPACHGPWRDRPSGGPHRGRRCCASRDPDRRPLCGSSAGRPAMKSLPPALQAHLDEGTTTLAWCWRIIRADGVTFGFTDHDRTLSFDGTEFEPESGLTASEVRSGSDLSVDAQDEYARVFEEEYELLKAEYLSELAIDNEAYRKYLASIDPAKTHNGYFSIDKKTNRLKDPAVGARSVDSDDVDAYDLILKDKERLLSFAEPTRFIFSHSALREGWDNPNVFVMCMLKHSDNTISRRQEVGRGLRL
ncbi:MAG: glycoside hydrolase TIM-barrel-like domain-containing protein, partial [Rubrimonas sp.]